MVSTAAPHHCNSRPTWPRPSTRTTWSTRAAVASTYSSSDANPITRAAPADRATAAHIRPTRLVIPVTTTVSSASTSATRRTAVCAVNAGVSKASAAAGSNDDGSRCTAGSGTTAYCPHTPGRVTPTPSPRTITVVPGSTTSELTTPPAPSEPGTNGTDGCLPASVDRSCEVTAASRISTNASPGPAANSTSAAFSCGPSS